MVASVAAVPAAALAFRQLFPEPVELELDAIVSSLDLLAGASPERPYTIANFVSSVDGRAAFQGHSGALGDEGDRALFHGLRERVDAVLAGTSTVRTERYGQLVRDPERRRRRIAAGLDAEPLACLVTRSGDIPSDVPLFAAPEARIVVFTPGPVELSGCAARVEVVELDPGELTLTTAMRRLRSEYRVRALLCEGGPTIFGALLQESLVDELFLTLSPKLVGGGPSPTITGGPELVELSPLGLRWALEREGSLYLRYALL